MTDEYIAGMRGLLVAHDTKVEARTEEIRTLKAENEVLEAGKAIDDVKAALRAWTMNQIYRVLLNFNESSLPKLLSCGSETLLSRRESTTWRLKIKSSKCILRGRLPPSGLR